jgi:hypothetical protein
MKKEKQDSESEEAHEESRRAGHTRTRIIGSIAIIIALASIGMVGFTLSQNNTAPAVKAVAVVSSQASSSSSVNSTTAELPSDNNDAYKNTDLRKLSAEEQKMADMLKKSGETEDGIKLTIAKMRELDAKESTSSQSSSLPVKSNTSSSAPSTKSSTSSSTSSKPTKKNTSSTPSKSTSSTQDYKDIPDPGATTSASPVEDGSGHYVPPEGNYTIN